jgi:hypothetical protein
MSMNWSDLLQQAEAGGSYEAIPEGTYNALVIDAVAKPSSTGKPMIVATFEVQGGPHAGRRVWNNFVITRDNANALAWFFKHMNALGLNKEFFALNPSLEACAEQLKGKHCVIHVGVRTWNGENRNNVDKVSPPAMAQATPWPGGQPTPTPTPVAQQADISVAQPTSSSAPPNVPF